jgi:hypothetical protein
VLQSDCPLAHPGLLILTCLLGLLTIPIFRVG